jgi:copper chaperone CopZ
MVAVLLLVVGASISLVAAWNNDPPVSLPEGPTRTSLLVGNLTCGACLARIEETLRQHEGMVGMEADLASGLVTVAHTAVFAPQRIEAAITEAGYPAQVLTEAEAAALASPQGAGGCRGCRPGGGCGNRGGVPRS